MNWGGFVRRMGWILDRLEAVSHHISTLGDLKKKLVTLLDLCVSSLRRGHANLLCIVPILTDGNLRRGSVLFKPVSLGA